MGQDQDVMLALARTRWVFNLYQVVGGPVIRRVRSDGDVVKVLRSREGLRYWSMEIG